MTVPLPLPVRRCRHRLPLLVAVAALAAALLVLVGAAPSAAVAPAPSHGVWPLQPRPPVVAGFDPPDSPWGAGHRGVDLGGRVGQQVHAALAGRITFAGRLAGRGVVVVDHGGTRTTYEPVEAGVRVGDRVATGAVIGRLQLFGSHCFPRACLHWGLIEGVDHYLDPLTLVGAAPVRLLPLAGPLPAADGVAARLAPSALTPATSGLGPLGVPGQLRFPGPAATVHSAGEVPGRS